jgi:mono/diheme cytochrome c family protein
LRLPPVAVALLFAASVGAAEEPAAAFETKLLPFLSRNCYACHGTYLKNADLNLEAFASAAAMLRDPDTWEKVVVKMRTRQMPPQGFPQPDAAEAQAVADWIESEFARAEATAPADPGRVTARRLNRTEYNNSLRDLLGVDLRPGDDFPHDDTGYGFDNNGDVLSLSPALMERYMTAAERVARTAIVGPPPLEPSLVRLQSVRSKVQNSTALAKDYDPTGLSLPNSLHAQHRFPVDGDYAFRTVLGGTRPAGAEPLEVGLFIDGKQVAVQSFDPEGTASFAVDRPDLSGKVVELRARIEAGDHWVAATILRLYEGLPASYGGPNPSKRLLPKREFKPRPGATPEQIEAGRKRFEESLKQVAPANEARISNLDVVGPYEPARGPSRRSLERVYACGHGDGRHDKSCPRRIVEGLAHRAYRRPVSAADVAPLLRLFDQGRKGGSFEDGLRLALQAMLVSPDFLFRIEEQRPASGGERFRSIGPHELASRLSYFLWASMPDDELLRLADDGRLAEPAVLEAQLLRMLKDPKAGALVDAFGGQWLQFRALEAASPNRDRFPDFDDYLRLSMRRETELLLETVVREDRSILELIDARYSFLNERLARHYGIPGVTGPEFRKVDLAGTQRRGILSHASVLTVSSYPTRTSPVLRGKWILENILAAPPPDPPAGTPRLDEATVGKHATLRQQLDAHRTGPSCAACHSRMDPLGFALENFDAIGAWRAKDGEFPVDARGSLPDGRSFTGPEEMTAILAGDKEAFAACITEKLLTYALGRGLERQDRRTVKAIAARVAEKGYHFSALVQEIVNSLPFRMKRSRTGDS